MRCLGVATASAASAAARAELWSETDRLLGAEGSNRFWSIYEDVRKDRGYVDFLETLARYHAADALASGDLDRAILDFPYVNYRYGDTLAVIASLWAAGTVVVLSDGDPVFQPLKIA